ncbi:MAG: hypothetical protein ACU85E_14655 [Gammaproteobacteria bacterium]
MQRCICCNARMGGAALCPRCRSDLSQVLAAENSAEIWLVEAIRLWQENKAEKSLDALERSLQLKSNRLALALRGYFIDRLCQDVLELLAQKRIQAAKRKLYGIRHLFPGNEQLFQLNAFTDYLWIED